MELTLNLAWLVLSAGLVVICRRQEANQRRAAIVISLICLIAVLFPVISITDDLNGAAMLADGKRWLFSVELAAVILAAFAAELTLLARLSEVFCSDNDSCSLERFSPALNRRPPPALY